jgi:hypothetical protein
MHFQEGNSLGKQFKPGQSGNPAGKPKGALHLSTHIQNMLNDDEFSMWLSDARDGFKEYKGAPIKAIIQTALIQAASKGKEGAAAREWLAKYGYGQKLEVEHSGEIKTHELSDDELREIVNESLNNRN